ncbi:hypothetical protein GUJ93_ZPchr0008g13069 [Zizania palustris]|uniref:LOB domain-containing protein n=1 Tax=Zizania palustris TaxID=103762 RepID=A0A8J5R3M0_ZIZPA|nr:hypothetical protein GUJ93_ZPchr0008g13069 [Zizania palustris]
MRMSCNGCRVLRKGCGEGCTIRPCLQWIKTSEAQANATVFLAKFYGRAGLLNLLAAAGSDQLRSAVFRSLLYEACGRIVNPIYGSVGLLWSGQWQACQAAVEAVLKGEPVVPISAEAAAATPPLRACDIRHVAKDADADADAAANLLRVARGGRTLFKRSSSSSTSKHVKAAKRASPSSSSSSPTHEPEPEAVVVVGDHEEDDHGNHRALSHEANDEESAGSHDHDGDDMPVDVPQREGSEDTEVEAVSHVSQAEHNSPVAEEEEQEEEEEVGLELTLGFEPLARVSRRPARPEAEARCDLSDLSAESSRVGVRELLPFF